MKVYTTFYNQYEPLYKKLDNGSKGYMNWFDFTVIALDFEYGKYADYFEVGFSFLGLGITITLSWIKDSVQDRREQK